MKKLRPIIDYFPKDRVFMVLYGKFFLLFLLPEKWEEERYKFKASPSYLLQMRTFQSAAEVVIAGCEGHEAWLYIYVKFDLSIYLRLVYFLVCEACLNFKLRNHSIVWGQRRGKDSCSLKRLNKGKLQGSIFSQMMLQLWSQDVMEKGGQPLDPQSK